MDANNLKIDKENKIIILRRSGFFLDTELAKALLARQIEPVEEDEYIYEFEIKETDNLVILRKVA